MSNLELGLREAGLWDDVVAGMRRTGLSLTQFLREASRAAVNIDPEDEYLNLCKEYDAALSSGNDAEAVRLFSLMNKMIPDTPYTPEEARDCL